MPTYRDTYKYHFKMGNKIVYEIYHQRIRGSSVKPIMLATYLKRQHREMIE